MAAQQVGVGKVDNPADVGVREAPAQGGEDGQAVNDVAEGARLEQDDAAGVDFGEGRSAPAGHGYAPSPFRGPRAAGRTGGSVAKAAARRKTDRTDGGRFRGWRILRTPQTVANLNGFVRTPGPMSPCETVLMMHHPSPHFSPRRLGLLSLPLIAVAATIFAADAPQAADGPEAHFRRTETLRLRGAAAFADAAREFDAAASAFADRRPQQKDDPEWAASARCAQAEMLLRLHKAKEARDVLAPLLEIPAPPDSPSRGLALFYHGAACFQLGDDMAAGRSLDQLAPFQDVAFGPAARRLLARLHERNDERAEALAQYEAVVSDYAERKKSGAAKGPPPEIVQAAAFRAAVLHYEDGQFEKRTTCSPMWAAAPAGQAADARLYQGCCEVQLKQFARAVETLSSVKDADPLTAAQVLRWLGRAQADAADPDDADARREARRTALETLDRAAQALRAPFDGDAAAFARECGDGVLREQADLHERLGEFAEAADLYARLRAGVASPRRRKRRCSGSFPPASWRATPRPRTSWPHNSRNPTRKACLCPRCSSAAARTPPSWPRRRRRKRPPDSTAKPSAASSSSSTSTPNSVTSCKHASVSLG